MKILRNIPIAPFTTYKIGGSAELFTFATNRDQLKKAVMYAVEHNIPYFVLGSGANILVSDEGFKGLVIRNLHNSVSCGSFATHDPEPLHYMYAGSGATIERLANYSRQFDLSGFEHFVGIPSTVGGALWQNLHFLNPERTATVYIADIFAHAIVLDVKTGKEDLISKIDFKFGYDTSVLHERNHVVLSAAFKLQRSDFYSIGDRMRANLQWRGERHPPVAVEPSCGSVFKKLIWNGEFVAAAKLIDQAGLKKFSIGDAAVSGKHPNFIVNRGDATAKDVRAIIDHVKSVVYDKFGAKLETEIGFVGDFD